MVINLFPNLNIFYRKFLNLLLNEMSSFVFPNLDFYCSVYLNSGKIAAFMVPIIDFWSDDRTTNMCISFWSSRRADLHGIFIFLFRRPIDKEICKSVHCIGNRFKPFHFLPYEFNSRVLLFSGFNIYELIPLTPHFAWLFIVCNLHNRSNLPVHFLPPFTVPYALAIC